MVSSVTQLDLPSRMTLNMISSITHRDLPSRVTIVETTSFAARKHAIVFLPKITTINISNIYKSDTILFLVSEEVLAFN